MYALGKAHRLLRAPPNFSEVSPVVPQKQFQCWSDWRCPFPVLKRKIVVDFLFLRLSPPGDRWCDVLGFMTSGNVSSSSTLQTFRNASHLWGLPCPPVYLLGYFFGFRQMQDGTSTPVFRESVSRIWGGRWRLKLITYLGHSNPQLRTNSFHLAIGWWWRGRGDSDFFPLACN